MTPYEEMTAMPPLPDRLACELARMVPADKRAIVVASHDRNKQRGVDIRNTRRERYLKLLDEETRFRLIIVSISIAKLIWDYSSTIDDLVTRLKIQELKPLGRAKKEIHKMFKNRYEQVLDVAHQERVDNLMYKVEDVVAQQFKFYTTNLTNDIKITYPGLVSDHIALIVAAYQCHMMYLVLCTYMAAMSRRVYRQTSTACSSIMPMYLDGHDTLVKAYIGEYPTSPMFQKQERIYASTLSNRLLEADFSNY